MKTKGFSRREFLQTSMGIAVGAMAGCSALGPLFRKEKPVVSAVKIKNGWNNYQSVSPDDHPKYLNILLSV